MMRGGLKAVGVGCGRFGVSTGINGMWTCVWRCEGGGGGVCYVDFIYTVPLSSPRPAYAEWQERRRCRGEWGVNGE